MLKKTVSLGILSAMISIACAADTADQSGNTDQNGNFDQAAAVQEIVSNLQLVGYPKSDIQVTEDNTVFVGLDAEVSLAASREMLGLTSREAPEAGVDYRQYRTNNLVSSQIDTICVDGSRYSGNFGTGLDNAIQRFNDQNLSFSMVRTNGNQNNCDALIEARIIGGGGGLAGFPSGGLPFDNINLGQDLSSAANSVVTHVIAHELGHTIGFRHSDFFDRRISCGPLAPNPNEGDGGIGAVHIPGTPTGAVINGSVMNACFNNGSTGVFTNGDVVALQDLYGGGGGGDDGGGDGGNGASCIDSNSCGGQAPAGCFCDDACVGFGDCCADGPC